MVSDKRLVFFLLYAVFLGLSLFFSGSFGCGSTGAQPGPTGPSGQNQDNPPDQAQPGQAGPDVGAPPPEEAQPNKIAPTLDSDEDGIADSEDNCSQDKNANQTDTDQDGSGDACDSDDDGDLVADADSDGVGDKSDNCINTANADQGDTDSDGVGNVCDSDDDGDGVADLSDNCPLVVNADQEDTPDGDGRGDPCDPDDNDNGIADASDPDNNRMTLWVATSGSDDPDPRRGDMDLPFATIEAALTDSVGLTPVRNVYVFDGTYNLSASLALIEGVSLYGGWTQSVMGIIRNLSPLQTVINSPVGSAAVTFTTGVTRATVIDGVEIDASDNGTGSSSIGLSIASASPTISRCRITSGRAETTSAAIAVTASGGMASPTIIDNVEILGGRATALESVSAGIIATAANGGSLTLTLKDNDVIAGGGAGTRSVGVSLVELDAMPGTSATAVIRGNAIAGDTDPTTAPTETLGLLLGEVVPGHGMEPPTAEPIRSATVEGNIIIGGAGSTDSFGLNLMVKSVTDQTLVANNIINGRVGTGGTNSRGVRLVGVASRVWLVNNTIDSGNAPTTPIALLMDDDNNGNASTPVVFNNIFTSTSSSSSSIGVDEGCAGCDPGRLESNLFDSGSGILDTYYRDEGVMGLTAIADVNAMGDTDTTPVNVADAPSLVQTSVPTEASYFHVGSGSAAIDAGQDAGILDINGDGMVDTRIETDIDGDARPANTAFDIGADERP